MTNTLASQNQLAQAYVAQFNDHAQGALIGNVTTTLRLHQWGEQSLPLSINQGEPNGTFVCCPRIGWVDFVREELAHFPNKWLVPPLRAVVRSLEVLTRICDLDRIVHVNNWLMSTNLPSGIDPDLSADQTRALVAEFPDHILAMRSLSNLQCGPLITALKTAGWIFLPTRQVFIVEDVARDSLSRRDARNDAKLWHNSTFSYEELQIMTQQDAERIAFLYDLLYLQKYSQLNPHYTPTFVRLAHDIGLLRFLVLRDAEGIIQGVGGMRHLGSHATMPLLGYNTTLPRERGLYRLACHAGSLYAQRHGLAYNMSSGATTFKQTRGAVGEIEYTAFYVRHLSRKRRMPFGGLQFIARHIGVPLLQRYNL